MLSRSGQSGRTTKRRLGALFGRTADDFCPPASPLSLIEAELLLQGPKPDLHWLGEVFKREVSLAAQLLRGVNEELDGRDRLFRIEDCITHLGHDRLREMLSNAEPLPKAASCTGIFNPHILLMHAQLTALASETIAFHMPGQNSEKAYIAGLLHNFDEFFPASAEDARDPQDKARNTVGAQLAASWSFPTFIVEIISWRYDPIQCPGDNLPLSCIVGAACEWASTMVRELTLRSCSANSSPILKILQRHLSGFDMQDFDSLVVSLQSGLPT